jgi:3-dehydroshikimate dehydratase
MAAAPGMAMFDSECISSGAVAMFTLSAFADEISPDPREQIAVLRSCGVRHIEFRSIFKTNVLALSDSQIGEFKSLLACEGFALSAIGSPVGKIAIDTPFEPHLDKFKRAIELAHRFGTPNIRIFSYYPPANTSFEGDWSRYRTAILERMAIKAEMAATAKITLFHENEHKIYGDSPDRVADLLESIASPALRGAYDAANYVFCGYDPIEGWEKTKAFHGHFHIKDWKAGEEHHGRLAGHGDGKIPHSIRAAVATNYDGFAVLEPHLRGGGPTGGVTGPDLFPVAVEAFRKILRAAGGQEQC